MNSEESTEDEPLISSRERNTTIPKSSAKTNISNDKAMRKQLKEKIDKEVTIFCNYYGMRVSNQNPPSLESDFKSSEFDRILENDATFKLVKASFLKHGWQAKRIYSGRGSANTIVLHLKADSNCIII